jgi:hypothetical protein
MTMSFNEMYLLSDKDSRGTINALTIDLNGYDNYNLFREDLEIEKELKFGYNFGTNTYSSDTRSRFPVISVHCLFKND